MRVLREKISDRNSTRVTFIQNLIVKNVSLSSSGGCAANAYNFSGDINGNYEIGCELQRKRVECAIMIKAALADTE